MKKLLIALIGLLITAACSTVEQGMTAMHTPTCQITDCGITSIHHHIQFD